MANYNAYQLNDKGEQDLKTGEIYVSVSQILAVESPGDFLNKWLLNTFDSFEAYQAFMDGVSTIGSSVHKLIELNLQGIEIPDYLFNQDNLPAFTSFLTWRERNKIEPLFIEKVLFSKSIRVAGTMDCVATINGEPYLCDIKTGSIQPKAFVQMAVYKFMAMEMGLDVKACKLAVIGVHRDGKPVQFVTMEDQFGPGISEEDLFSWFMCLRQVWAYRNLNSIKWKPVIKHYEQYVDQLMQGFSESFKRLKTHELKPAPIVEFKAPVLLQKVFISENKKPTAKKMKKGKNIDGIRHTH